MKVVKATTVPFSELEAGEVFSCAARSFYFIKTSQFDAAVALDSGELLRLGAKEKCTRVRGVFVEEGADYLDLEDDE